MTTSGQFPLTNQALYAIAQGELVRFPASVEAYWELFETAEYRADYYNHEIVAARSYEPQNHFALMSEVFHLLKMIFPKNNALFNVHNSNPKTVQYA